MSKITNNLHQFPAGTVVGLWPTAGTNEAADRGDAPAGESVATATVDEYGVLTFEVDDSIYETDEVGVMYHAAAPVDGLLAGGVTIVPKERSTVQIRLFLDDDVATDRAQVNVEDRKIEIELASGSDGLSTTSGKDLVSAINGNADAFALVTAGIQDGSEGDEIIEPGSADTTGGTPRWRYVSIPVTRDEKPADTE